MNAVSYARISTLGQFEGASLESQLSANQKWAEANGYEIIKEVQEIHSGSELFERPLLNDIRDEIRKGFYQALIVYDVDRLTRNVSHLGVLVSETERFNTRIVFVTGDFEKSPEGMLLLAIRGYLAEAERVKIIERTKRGRQAKARNGTLSYKRKLYGYQLDENGNRYIFEPEAKNVRKMFELYLSGLTLASISNYLNERQILTPKGSVWWAMSIRQILTNPAYAGRTVVFRLIKERRFVEGEKRWKYVKTYEQDWVELPPDTTPAIIEKEIFEQVQTLLTTQKQVKKKNIKHAFLLRGMINCGVCNRKMSTQTAGKYRGYVCVSSQNATVRCGVKICNADKAESLVWSEVLKFMNVKRLQRDLMKAKESLQPKVSEKRRINKSIQKLEREIENLINRAADVSDAIWTQLKIQIANKQQSLTELKVQSSQLVETDIDLSGEKLLQYAIQIQPELSRLGFDEKVEVLKRLGAEVVWDGETVHFNINVQNII
jgi:DNA invertase Pin-like site-specific DNA recombinase